MSPPSNYIAVMVGFELAGMKERNIDACVQQTDANVVPSIMVWDAFHKSELDIVDGPMNQRVYWWVLRQNILPCARDTFRNNFVLVQDDGCLDKISCPVLGIPFAITLCWFKIMLFHTRHGPVWIFENQNVEVMDWPAKSPDMNPIGHIWGQIAIHIRDMDNPLTIQQQLRDAVMASWDTLRLERLGSLVRSMPRRVRAVQDTCGRHTRC